MKKIFHIIKVLLVASFILNSCSTDFLDEVPKDFLSPENAYLNQAGFEAGIAALHNIIRQDETIYRDQLWYGTDAMRTGEPNLARWEDYSIVTPVFGRIREYWDNAYLNIFPNANLLISKAENPDVEWNTATSKQEIIAEARFFRGYSYNILACLYGGVPIVTEPSATPSVSYTRATKQETLEQARKDLEFAAQYLPETPEQTGRISKAAAYHFLAEVYNHLGMYQEAIDAASSVIDNPKYKLMTQRFGVKKDDPGDVISDLNTEGNENLDINTEAIWVIQVEYDLNGGGRNASQFAWNPRYWNAYIPGTTKKGFIVVDTLARPAGYLRGTNLFNYFIWSDENDIRNSEYNIKRTFYYNNPQYPEYFGKKITLEEYYNSDVRAIDTIMNLYPFLYRVYGEPLAGMGSRQNYKDIYRVRLAETYLLRAEAYLLDGQAGLAAADINTVRARANAAPVSAADVSLDYILDERLRELYVEEYRRCTLQRMGKLVERVRKYNSQAGPTIADYNNIWPIPQTAIDRNFGAVLEQNPGY
jgi:hypothetical protein